jgi:hypothetical protein
MTSQLLRGSDSKHGRREVQAHNVVSGLGQQHQNATGSRIEFKDRFTEAQNLPQMAFALLPRFHVSATVSRV